LFLCGRSPLILKATGVPKLRNAASIRLHLSMSLKMRWLHCRSQNAAQSTAENCNANLMNISTPPKACFHWLARINVEFHLFTMG